MHHNFPCTKKISVAIPLWQLAPTKDQHGKSAADFMMMIPQMAKRGDLFAEQVALEVRSVCASFDQQVLFVDLNVRLGVIWVSVQAKRGLCAEVACAIRQRVPEALMVGDQLAGVPKDLSVGDSVWKAFRKLLNVSRIPRLGARHP